MLERLDTPLVEPDVILLEVFGDVGGRLRIETVQLGDAVADRAERHDSKALCSQPLLELVQSARVRLRQVKGGKALVPRRAEAPSLQQGVAGGGVRPAFEHAGAEAPQVAFRL